MIVGGGGSSNSAGGTSSVVRSGATLIAANGGDREGFPLICPQVLAGDRAEERPVMSIQDITTEATEAPTEGMERACKAMRPEAAKVEQHEGGDLPPARYMLAEVVEAETDICRSILEEELEVPEVAEQEA